MHPMWLRSLALSASSDVDWAWRLVSMAMRIEAYVSGLVLGLTLIALAFIASLGDDET